MKVTVKFTRKRTIIQTGEASFEFSEADAKVFRETTQQNRDAWALYTAALGVKDWKEWETIGLTRWDTNFEIIEESLQTETPSRVVAPMDGASR